MTYLVAVTERANGDIAEATAWWASNRSREQAERWNIGIHRALRTLAEEPRRFPLAPENDGIESELRQLPFGLGRRPTHRVLFTIDDEDAVVRVLLVRHVARDIVAPDDLR